MTLRGARGRDLLSGEAFTLAAAAARTATAGTNGTAYVLGGERSIIGILLNITDCEDEAADTLDVYIDFLGPDGATWLNAGHFTQEHGDHAASMNWVTLVPNTGSAAQTVVTADAAAGTFRPEVFGSQIRARWVIVEGNADADATFTFSITAYAM